METGGMFQATNRSASNEHQPPCRRSTIIINGKETEPHGSAWHFADVVGGDGGDLGKAPVTLCTY